jgi:hypothetical protein
MVPAGCLCIKPYKQSKRINCHHLAQHDTGQLMRTQQREVNMALMFAISGDPPTLDEIMAEREHAEKALAVLRKKDIRFIAVGIIMLASILSFQLLVTAPAVADPSMEPGIVGIITLYTPYIIGVFFFSALTLNHKLIEKPRKALRAVLNGLKEIRPEQLANVTAAGQQHSEIAAYLDKVATLGRAPLEGELQVIQRWIDKHKPIE